MKTRCWISLAAVAAMGAVLPSQAADTTKGERFGVGPIYGVKEASGGAKLACPRCKQELVAVRVPMDSKERAFGTRYVQEHRCSACTFGLRVTKAGSKETRTVMECGSCAR